MTALELLKAVINNGGMCPYKAVDLNETEVSVCDVCDSDACPEDEGGSDCPATGVERITRMADADCIYYGDGGRVGACSIEGCPMLRNELVE